jgi:hypothetical protein
LLDGIAYSFDISEAYWKTADLSEAKDVNNEMAPSNHYGKRQILPDRPD